MRSYTFSKLDKECHPMLRRSTQAVPEQVAVKFYQLLRHQGTLP
jgi:hypothetical protein